MTGTLLQGGRIRTTFDGEAIDSIGVRDGRIVAVDDGSFDDTIDLDGAWVVPGLIDTHPHLLHFSIAGLGRPSRSSSPPITRRSSKRSPGRRRSSRRASG